VQDAENTGVQAARLVEEAYRHQIMPASSSALAVVRNPQASVTMHSCAGPSPAALTTQPPQLHTALVPSSVAAPPAASASVPWGNSPTPAFVQVIQSSSDGSTTSLWVPASTPLTSIQGLCVPGQAEPGRSTPVAVVEEVVEGHDKMSSTLVPPRVSPAAASSVLSPTPTSYVPALPQTPSSDAASPSVPYTDINARPFIPQSLASQLPTSSLSSQVGPARKTPPPGFGDPVPLRKTPPPGFESTATWPPTAARSEGSLGGRPPPPGFGRQVQSAPAGVSVHTARGPPPGFEGSALTVSADGVAATATSRGPPPGFIASLQAAPSPNLIGSMQAAPSSVGAATSRAPPPGFGSPSVMFAPGPPLQSPQSAPAASGRPQVSLLPPHLQCMFASPSMNKK
jgi:hypothetical protein